MNNQKDKLSCDIVQDLLPLYHDEVVSSTTRSAVADHLETCEFCKDEYKKLCSELPIEEKTPSTKKKFLGMIRTHKKLRILMLVTIVLAMCITLVGGFFLQLQLPIVKIPDDEITVHRIYRYETAAGYKFFIFYSHPYYDSMHAEMEVLKGENGDETTALRLNVKRPLITKKYTNIDFSDHIWVYECGYESADNGEIVFNAFDQMIIGGEIVWDVEKNKDDVIPEYVYAYEEFESHTGKIAGWSTSLEDGWFLAMYSDGTSIKWDFDGNVIN